MSVWTYADGARDLAALAHAGQVDKAGAPYIEHVRRVADAVSGDPVTEAVAWLHDVVEDCPDLAGSTFLFPVEVVRSVLLLTRTKGEDESVYYARIAADPVARRVKLADIADNADESRLSRLPADVAERLRIKYRVARGILESAA